MTQTNGKIRVLVFPAGAENALDIFASLRYSLRVEVFGASAKSDHASFVYPGDRYFEGDYSVGDPRFLDTFNALLEQEGIDIVIPTHDTVALFLAQHRDGLSARILTAEYETALICREKRRTFELFGGEAFCPEIFTSLDGIPESGFPVFLKPNIGEGAKGASVADTRAQAEARLAENPELVICEYLPGDELTVDCFTDKSGDLRFVGARSRERVQMGISFRSASQEASREIGEIASVINSRLRFKGDWFFQLKRAADGRYKLLEVSCRHAGTMELFRHKGINFALLGVFEHMGIDTSFVLNEGRIMLDRCIASRYSLDIEFDKVYLDFDDTLVIDGKVNTPLIALLYQFINDEKSIMLITRHENDIDRTLEEYRISRGLFSEIITLPWSERKADYIRRDKSIFIDNSYAEREAVHKELGIPVFDVDAIDALIHD